MRLLILYEELAPYFLVCISEFSKINNAEIHIIKKSINKEAPFEFSTKSINIYSREEYTSEELFNLAQQINPTAIFCGGWMTKNYLKICSGFKGEIPIVVGFDNKWDGSIKQQIKRIIFPFLITNKFDACFVPGTQQKKFALKIGFKENKIRLGAYSCDFNLFHDQYQLNKQSKEVNMPKRFIFVGRYYEFKGIKDLWNAFIELQNENPNDWELWCLGTGDIEQIKHEKIKHFGFVQPKDLPEYIKNTSVFVLPSHFEPWGVVIHEFAAAGFPIVCSDNVGAAEAFVKNNVNGFIFKSRDVADLKEQLHKVINLSNFELNKMGEESVNFAKKITPSIWAQQLIDLVK